MTEHTNTTGKLHLEGNAPEYIGLTRRTFFTLAGTSLAFLASAGFTLSTPEKSYAVTAAQKQAEANEALKKLDAMQEELDKASADYYTALDEQQEAQTKMDDAQSRIDETNEKIAEVQSQLATRVRSMYRTGSVSFIDLLLGSTSYRAFTSNWNFLNDMNDSDSAMVEQSKALRAQVEQEKATYTEQEKIAAQKAQVAEQVKSQAEALVDEMQATYDSLSAEASELLEQERRAAEEEAARRAAAEEAARQKSVSSVSTVNDSKSQTVPGSTVVERAYAHLGCPYSWGATGPKTFDCSGFVSMCLSGKYGCRLGTTYTFMRWPRVGNPQPGDICTNSHHCGIYIGNGQMIHAPQTGDVVKISAVHSGMIYVRY